MNSLWKRLRRLFRKQETERDLDEELTSYVTLLTDEKLRSGLPEAEARRAALVETGGVEQVKEAVRDARGLNWLDVLFQDLRHGSRLLARSPGFTATVVLTLALGIGATTAIFTVVNAVLLRPLPYLDPDSLVYVRQELPPYGVLPFHTRREFENYRNQAKSFENLAAYMGTRVNLSGGGQAERVQCLTTTSSLFTLLPLRPALGRGFLPADDLAGSPPVAIVSHNLWQGRLGGDRNILNRSITVDGRSFHVVGVLPAGFELPDRYGGPKVEIWLPIWVNEFSMNSVALVSVLGRLKPGVGMRAAQAELDSILKANSRRKGKVAHAVVVGWHDEVAGSSRKALLVFLGAVTFVLLIACVNVAILLLSRAASREREIGVRLALGAGRGRLLRQLLTESSLLSVMGALAGLAVAVWGKNALVLFLADQLPTSNTIPIDLPVLGFTTALAVFTGILFGLPPALQALRTPAQVGLSSGTRGATPSRARHRLRGVLVVCEAALAVVLTIGAGLLVHSFLRLRTLPMGYQEDRVLTFAVELPGQSYPKPEQQGAFFEEALRRVQSLPGVRSAAWGTCNPLGGRSLTVSELEVEGSASKTGHVQASTISPDYFQTMGIPLRAGRSFTPRDEANSPRVVIVSETFARLYCNGAACLGRKVEDWSRKNGWLEVVGVAADTRQHLEAASEPLLYVNAAQNPDPMVRFVVKTHGEPLGLAGAVREQIAAIDRDQPVFDLQTLSEARAQSMASRRANMVLLGGFALLAMLLASVGIYGVVSYTAVRRTSEIGIRMALGAQRKDVQWLVISQTLRLVILGEVLGVLGALALNRVLSTFVAEVKTTDPLTYAAAAVLWAGVALLAGYVPARRGSRIDPMLALRSE
jgi:putative ABC transport system permease protein